MSLFRSDRMGYYNIVMPRESAWEIMNDLGEVSALQFVDLNEHEQVFSRPYANYVKRCEEMEIKIQAIEQEMGKFNKPIQRCENVKAFLKNLRDFLGTRNKAEHTYFDDLENELDERMAALNEQIKTYDSLVEKYNHLVEYIHVLEKTKPYLGDGGDFQGQNVGLDEESKNIDYVANRSIKFCYLAGVIDREDSQRFRRMLFRATLGMTWTVLLDIESQPEREGRPAADNLMAGSKGENKQKTVFLIVYQGGAYDVLKGKLNKIADSFGASKYGIPEDGLSFAKKLREVHDQRDDAQRVVQVTRNHIDMVLETFSQPRFQNGTWSLIEDYRLFVLKEKSIYHNLNMLKLQNTIYHGNCWCPIESESHVKNSLNSLAKRKPHIAGAEFQYAERPEHSAPPTHFRTNDFTAPFQEIVNTYGVPRYREVNPGLFTIATFPFLFGVMFGDIGHGGIVFIFGLYLCFRKDELERDKSALAPLLQIRYLLAMMGFFAFYCGFIYNDFMAMPWDLFGTCYHDDGHGGKLLVREKDCVYPFGVDPSWYGTINELTFFNSFKMKTSILLGVTQMAMGVMLKMLNAIHFRSATDFLFEWIPQICFLMATFGYMVLLIVIKWTTSYAPFAQRLNPLVPPTPNNEVYPMDNQAPNIINIFIKFLLGFGTFDTGVINCTEESDPYTFKAWPLYGDKCGVYQGEVQRILLIIALIAVPMMLIPKPVILFMLQKKSQPQDSAYGGSHLDDHEAKKAPLLAHYNRDVNDISYTKEESKENEHSRPEDVHEVQPQHATGHAAQGGHGHGEEGFGDIFVHQLIETIEFVLGSVSHTASYLRLWALSLAHSQLAKVFFDKTMGGAIQSGSFPMAFLLFPLFAAVTFAVLLCMDLMECFLHALRLHWVEFQSKFYKADGYLFTPFSFEKTLKAEAKE